MKKFFVKVIRWFRRESRLYGIWTDFMQKRFLRHHPPGADGVVLFLVPGLDEVNGGIMAIVHHAEESRRLLDSRRTAVFLCTMPGHRALWRFTRFKNKSPIVPFGMLMDVLPSHRRAHINIPEVYVQEFAKNGFGLLAARGKASTSFNVMLQNIDFAPDRFIISKYREYGEVTATTAHKVYASKVGKILGCPAWHWSVWVSPEKYTYRDIGAKENIIVVSPDLIPERDRILAALHRSLPEYQIIKIWGFTYEEYKKLIGRARYSLTFGEGLDGYFVEPILSGSVGLAVYNDRFFTEEYRNLAGVFRSWTDLELRLPGLIRDMSSDRYDQIRGEQYVAVTRNYAHAEYSGNLRKYYGDLSIAGLKSL